MIDSSRLPNLTPNDAVAEVAWKLRTRLFSSQKQAAGYLPVSRATIVRYENGDLKAPLGYIAYLMKLIGDALAKEGGDATSYRQVLVQEMNKVLRRFYEDQKPFENWDTLCRVVDSYLAERRPTKAPATSLEDSGPFQAGSRSSVTAPTQAPATNLREQTTNFIGRGKEIEEIKRLRKMTRLLTLTGAGGTGKSRLAMHVAAGLIEEFPDGVWVVDLLPLLDPELAHVDTKRDQLVIIQAVAELFAVQEVRGQPLLTSLASYLHDKQILLLLDNCEHLIEACAYVVEVLLQSCPHLLILATSREALGIDSETLLRVPSLMLPPTRRRLPLDQLLQYEAVSLFMDRALKLKSDLVVSEADVPSVVEICRRLDGIPLALELAAARVKVLTINEIARLLDDRFHLLTSGSRTALPRHRTLQAAIAWSFDLLTYIERHVLQYASVFAGGWTLEAAQTVCMYPTGDMFATLNTLEQLVNKSLVVAEEQIGQTRYRLLETIREFARDKLRERHEEEGALTRHQQWYLRLAEQEEQHLKGGPQQETAFKRLETEYDNFRTALDWALVRGEMETAARLAGALWRFWVARGYLSEGRRRLEAVLAAAQGLPLDVQAKTLSAAGVLSAEQGDYRAARSDFEVAVAIYRELADPQGQAAALNGLGYVAYDQSDNQLADACWQESLQLYEGLNDMYGMAAVLNNLGMIAFDIGNGDRAEQFYRRSLELARGFDDREGMARALSNLGLVVLQQGDDRQAYALYQESLALCAELGDNLGIALCLEGLASVATARRHFATAAELFGASEALRETSASQMEPAYLAIYERYLADARAQADPAIWDAAWARGRMLLPNEAAAFAAGEFLQVPG